jgi:hypothetical protein
VLTQFRPRFTAAVTASLVPLFTSALTVLHKGITLLELSYRGTIQQGQLSRHYAAIIAVCRYIGDFWTTHTQGAILEAAMQRAFDAVGPATVDIELRREPWADWTVAHPDPWSDGGPRAWRFPEDVGRWLTVARRPQDLERSSGPPGRRGPIVSLLQPGFRFGTSVEQVGFREHTSPRGRPWVSYGRLFETTGGLQPVAYPVPTLSDLFGSGGPPPSLQAMTDGIARLELLTAPE